MGTRKKERPAKLIAGFIFNQDAIFLKAKKGLQRKFGSIDLESPTLPFLHTDYYSKEMGTGLKRKFLSFNNLILPSRLAAIKIFTNDLENALSHNLKRQINIDPGYLETSKLVLATTKNYNHRIYINRGIYAEVTLFFQNHTFKPWDWTYPDYRTPAYIEVFNNIRQIYLNQIKTA